MEGRELTSAEWSTFKQWVTRKDYGALRAFFQTTPINTRCHAGSKFSLLRYVSSIFVPDAKVFEIIVEKALEAGDVFRIDTMFEAHQTQHLEVLMNAGVSIDPTTLMRRGPCACLPSACECVLFKEFFMQRIRSLQAIMWCFAHIAPAFVDVFHECFGEIFRKTQLNAWGRRRRRSGTVKKKMKK